MQGSSQRWRYPTLLYPGILYSICQFIGCANILSHMYRPSGVKYHRVYEQMRNKGTLVWSPGVIQTRPLVIICFVVVCHTLYLYHLLSFFLGTAEVTSRLQSFNFSSGLVIMKLKIMTLVSGLVFMKLKIMVQRGSGLTTPNRPLKTGLMTDLKSLM